MEESLTDCLVNIRGDLSQMKRVREYLDSNTQSEGSCLMSWRTIEAFNSILGACRSQDTPQVEALDTILDSFYFLVSNNHEDSFWSHFGFEIGEICLKILSAIDRTDMFEDLFYKLLMIINAVPEHSSDVWKAVARLILNLFINKNFCFSYFEKVLRMYISILKKVDEAVLKTFGLNNLHLLKTLSSLLGSLGDFETQVDFIEFVFLHVPDRKSLEGFFTDAKGKVGELFQTLRFTDFEDDCRTYLNALNKEGTDRKVFSICCNKIHLGGCFVDPPPGRKTLWLDANKDSDRLSLKCSDFREHPTTQRIIYIRFSDLFDIALEKDGIGNHRLTIKSKNLERIYKEVKNDEVMCMALKTDNTRDDILEFVEFLEEKIRRENKKRKKLGGKLSYTYEYVFVDRIRTQIELLNKAKAPQNGLQDNAISSSVSNRLGSKNALDLFGKGSPEHKNLLETLTDKISPIPVKRDVVLESQELTPNSFAESLSKNLEQNSLEFRHSFEDVIPTVEFRSKSQNSAKKSHKLFRSPQKAFLFEDFSQQEDKENEPPVFKLPPTRAKTPKMKENTPSTRVLRNRKDLKSKLSNTQCEICPQAKPTAQTKTLSPKEDTTNTRVLRDRKNLEPKLSNTQSQECFQAASKPINKKPSMPKLKKRDGCVSSKKKKTSEPKRNAEVLKTHHDKPSTTTRTSLLDPNGYAYQRWIKPTTSKRSNFWLEKLNALQKDKQGSGHVFEFSDESETDVKKNRKSTGGIRKPRGKKKEKMKQPSVKEILKSNKWKVSPRVPPRKGKDNLNNSRSRSVMREEKQKSPSAENEINENMSSQRTPETKKSSSPEADQQSVNNNMSSQRTPETRKSPSPEAESICDNVSSQRTPEFSKKSLSPETDLQSNNDDIPSRRTSSEHSCDEANSANPTEEEFDDLDELSISSEEDNQPEIPQNKKRERSEEENSLTKALIKKKPKTLNRKSLPTVLQRRLEKVEETVKQQTDEIIETIDKASRHMLDHLQRKENQRMVSYLTAVGEAGVRLQEIDDSRLRAKRVEKVIAFYEAGCSVHEICDLMDAELSKVRSALKELTDRSTDSEMKVCRINDRLKSLIGSEIDRWIKSELRSRRDRIMRCLRDDYGASVW